MSIPLPPLPEPFGCVTIHAVTGQHFFYRHPNPPYLDTARECITVFAWVTEYAAAVTAAKDAEISGLREALQHVERVMGPKVPPCCDGCSYEWGEALRTVRAALGDKNG